MNPNSNHLANWCLSFAAASVGVWLTWLNYQWLDVRIFAPDWVLHHERALFTFELLTLMVGTLVTAYRENVFTEPALGLLER